MSIVKRWAVTYTKHLKQKRKVYQDGVLELCGSGKKVLLYDDCEKLIDSKFLKNDEVIECGTTVTLEAHLVDIGVLEESRAPLADINVTEWNALYTTQITQKAKKFHDGFLRLSVCGSYIDQVTSLNEEGVVLGSKYVKSSEFIKIGKTFELPNYLVEIFELRTVEGVSWVYIFGKRDCNFLTIQHDLNTQGSFELMP
ncbi:hypothetical protein IHE45_12G034600 [Dioscorea alata]|uniref:Uncharacterized protein n=1 Tax=Dioscorea alata TaxID=55571 RepID=A0ACB7V1L8_DIOAL|nr:hypothetical protein IHE45_12G034600 [Dioscorea alata]